MLRLLLVLFCFTLMLKPAVYANNIEEKEAEVLRKYYGSDLEALLNKPKNWPPKITVRKKDASDEEIETLEAALKALNSWDYALVERAIWKLEVLGEKAVPSLITILSNTEYNDRIYINTLYATGRIGKGGAKASNVVAQYLTHENPDYRAIAANALARMGHHAKRAIPYLRRALDDDNSWVQLSAERALFEIGTPNALRALKEHKMQAKE